MEVVTTMNQELILWPILAQVILTLGLFIRLGQVKDQARAANEVDLGVTALDNDAWPDYVRQVANCMRNQFQVPVLFYVLLFMLFVLDAVETVAIVLAWLFIASRLVHAFIHTGTNHVPHRTRVFKLSVLLVIGLSALVIRALAT